MNLVAENFTDNIAVKNRPDWTGLGVHSYQDGVLNLSRPDHTSPVNKRLFGQVIT